MVLWTSCKLPVHIFLLPVFCRNTYIYTFLHLYISIYISIFFIFHFLAKYIYFHIFLHLLILLWQVLTDDKKFSLVAFPHSFGPDCLSTNKAVIEVTCLLTKRCLKKVTWLFKLHPKNYTQSNAVNQYLLQIREVLTLLPKVKTITKQVSFFFSPHNISLESWGREKEREDVSILITIQNSLPIKKPSAWG